MSVFSHYLFSFLGFALALILAVRLLRERRNPGSTMAWLLAILLIPYIGVPLYLLFGGRKLRRLASEKFNLSIAKRDSLRAGPPQSDVERILHASGFPPALSGNEVELLTTREQAYVRLMELIESAKHSIYITTFILGRDPVGRAIVGKLAEKASRGIKVRVLLDALGSLKTRGRFIDPVRKAGGQVGIFMPMLPLHKKWSANLRNHRKIVVVDHETALVGGMNLGEPYMGPYDYPNGWTDFGLIIRGSTVDHLSSLFAQDWEFATNRTLPETPETPPLRLSENARLQIVPSGPDLQRDGFYEALILALLHAKERVWIVTPYFIPDEVLFQALILLGRLGRDVRILVPAKSNHFIADLARGSYIRELSAAGVRFFQYMNGMLHAKILIIDDSLAVTGSGNLDARSLHLNYEVSVFIHSSKEVGALAEVGSHLFAFSKAYEEREKGLFGQGIQEWIEDATRIIAPLL